MPPSGIDVELSFRFAGFAEAARPDLAGVVRDTATEIASDAQMRIQTGAKTGRTYRRSPVKRTVGAKAGKGLEGLGLTRTAGDTGGAGQFIVGYNFHQASAPWQSPATDVGGLAESIHTDLTHADADLSAEVIVGEGLIGSTLEMGTKDGKTILPRPFLTPAVEAAQDKFIEDGYAAIDRAAQRATA